MKLPDDVLKNLKVAYKMLYTKSREHKVTKEQQDAILDKMVEIILAERLSKIVENENISEQDATEICNELKSVFQTLKNELDKT